MLSMWNSAAVEAANGFMQRIPPSKDVEYKYARQAAIVQFILANGRRPRQKVAEELDMYNDMKKWQRQGARAYSYDADFHKITSMLAVPRVDHSARKAALLDWISANSRLPSQLTQDESALYNQYTEYAYKDGRLYSEEFLTKCLSLAPARNDSASKQAEIIEWVRLHRMHPTDPQMMKWVNSYTRESSRELHRGFRAQLYALLRECEG